MEPATREANTPDLSQPGEKPTNEELRARIIEVLSLLGQGYQRREIARYVATKTSWKVAPRTLDRYIAAAKRMLAKAGREKHDYIIGLARFRFDEIYARALLDKQYGEARESVRDLCRLFGVQIDQPHGRGTGSGEEHDPNAGHGNRIAIIVAPERAQSIDVWQQNVLAMEAERQTRLSGSAPSGPT